MHAENIRGQAECSTVLIVGAPERGEGRFRASLEIYLTLPASDSWSTTRQRKSVTPQPPAGNPPHFTKTLTSIVATTGESNVTFDAIVTGLPFAFIRVG
jgi:hypothetical protein